MGVNKVILIGNLGADPELRYTGNQTAVCTMRVATGERRRDPSGNWVDHTEWHRVIAFGKTAENCSQYLAKGRQVYVEGRIQTNKWQDKEGRDRYTTEIIASTVQFLGNKSSLSNSVHQEVTSNEVTSNVEDVMNSLQSADSIASGGQISPQPAAEIEKPEGEISFEDDDIPF